MRFGGWDEQGSQRRIESILELAAEPADPDVFAIIVHELLGPSNNQ